MASSNVVSIGPLRLANDRPLALIAGPCVIESEELTLRVAKSLKETAAKLRIPFIFKCSYDKANRSSIGSYRGVGVREGLEILARVKREVSVPVLTDIHAMEDIAPVAAVVDVLQIPAFLCRQTDLVVGAIKSGRVVNVKKGQFLSPWEAANIVEKARAAGGERLMLTERGATFGYNNLVVDMRSLEVMKGHGVPVVFDATHSVQLPGGQ
ncbi:MAG TPA: 3-deoxy-8-phosphooctulonate synthase, partial [Elusimicrobiota bacterium]|nr:3-deoxy-8-phosphooctulonate synthase [Elusimicrobiota bacterium]